MQIQIPFNSPSSPGTDKEPDGRGEHWLALAVLLVVVVGSFIFGSPGAPVLGEEPMAAGATAPPPASPRPTLPSDAKPPGEREPLVGFLAAASIVIAAGAGIYVYRVIRKGL